jgi:hypothetical protein
MPEDFTSGEKKEYIELLVSSRKAIRRKQPI